MNRAFGVGSPPEVIDEAVLGVNSGTAEYGLKVRIPVLLIRSSRVWQTS
jgi:hypothetical protein